MKQKKIIVLFFLGILLTVVFIIIKSILSKVETGTVEEALLCMEKYVNEIKQTPEYPLVIEGLNNYLVENKVLLNKFGTDSLVSLIDSAVLFNEAKDFTCMFLNVQTPKFARNDYAYKFNGTLKNGKWEIESGLSIIYPRVKDSSGHYITHSLEYLSKETRLEFIADGFFKNKECEINWDYVEKWRED